MRSLLESRHRRTLLGTLIACAAAVGLFAGCTSSQDPDAEAADELTAARAAAEEYVAAVAASDLEAVEALSADEALVVRGLDVTEALTQTQTPISAEWVEFLGREGAGGDPPQYTFEVSYLVGENVGADRITLELVGHDPVDPAGWTVTEGLLTTARVPADREGVHQIAFGPVELGPLSSGNVTSLELSGYPGAYQVEVTDADPEVDMPPGTVVLGAQTTESWNSTPPLIEGE